MKCIICKTTCLSYVCEACRVDANEISDSRGRPLAFITGKGEMYKLPFARIYKANEIL